MIWRTELSKTRTREEREMMEAFTCCLGQWLAIFLVWKCTEVNFSILQLLVTEVVKLNILALKIAFQEHYTLPLAIKYSYVATSAFLAWSDAAPEGHWSYYKAAMRRGFPPRIPPLSRQSCSSPCVCLRDPSRGFWPGTAEPPWAVSPHSHCILIFKQQ